jgi:hypothetical protein
MVCLGRLRYLAARSNRLKSLEGNMKPAVNRVATVPMTALLCCPQCYRLISYNRDQALVQCHGCGTTVRSQDLPRPFASSANQG